MRKGGGKQKGSQFERDIAVALSQWVSFGYRKDLYWRSAMSGGRATVARKGGTNLESQAGDLSAVHPSGQPFLDKFYVELKFYRDLNFTGLLAGTGKLVEFWGKTCEEASHYKRNPMLIAKQNRLPTLVIMDGVGCGVLGLSKQRATLACPNLTLHAFLLDTFVKHAKPLIGA